MKNDSLMILEVEDEWTKLDNVVDAFKIQKW